jgi:putative ABC transport system ATP-binding protein
MVEPTPLLTADRLGCRVAGRWLWRDLNFALGAGEGLGLVAPSGAGKTLLLRTLVLLDPLQTGTIHYAGRPLAQWALPTYRTQVIYLPQRAIAFEGTVADNLQRVFALASQRHRRYQPEQILTWLEALGRGPEFLTRSGLQLSGGEAQILALLRALQLDPQILLLDESTASLDPVTTAQVEQLLSQWLRVPHHACIFTSHDPEQIRRFTHRQLSLEPVSNG